MAPRLELPVASKLVGEVHILGSTDLNDACLLPALQEPHQVTAFVNCEHKEDSTVIGLRVVNGASIELVPIASHAANPPRFRHIVGTLRRQLRTQALQLCPLENRKAPRGQMRRRQPTLLDPHLQPPREPPASATPHHRTSLQQTRVGMPRTCNSRSASACNRTIGRSKSAFCSAMTCSFRSMYRCLATT